MSQILLSVFGAAVVVICIVVALFALKLYLWCRNQSDFSAIFMLPSAIRVISITKRTTQDYQISSFASARIDQWKELSFNYMEVLEVSCGPLPTIAHLLVDEKTQCFVLVHDDNQIGVWSELYERDHDQIISATSNKPLHKSMEWMPGEMVYRRPNESEKDMYEFARSNYLQLKQATAERKQVSLKLFYEEQCRNHVAQIYTKKKWTDQDLISMLTPPDYSADMFDDDLDDVPNLTPKLRKNIQSSMSSLLTDLCAEHFIRHIVDGVPDWWPERQRLHVVHDYLSIEGIRSQAEWPAEHFHVSSHLKDRLRKYRSAGDTFREQFQALNRQIPKGNRYRKVASVDWIVPADIYIHPLNVDELVN